MSSKGEMMKVKDFYGKIHRVSRTEGNTLYLTDGTWIHQSKCLFWSETLKQWVSIPPNEEPEDE